MRNESNKAKKSEVKFRRKLKGHFWNKLINNHMDSKSITQTVDIFFLPDIHIRRLEYFLFYFFLTKLEAQWNKASNTFITHFSFHINRFAGQKLDAPLFLMPWAVARAAHSQGRPCLIYFIVVHFDTFGYSSHDCLTFVFW